MNKIDLKGNWSFCLDKEKLGMEEKFYGNSFNDTIMLPTTVSEAKKGTISSEANIGYLTDPYYYEGYTWYSRTVGFEPMEGKELFLILERTRISHVWIDDQYVGTNSSLCSFHRYQLTPFIHQSTHKLTIMVDNTSYPVKGGHMTSPDTQTNWNGITGEIYIEVRNKVYLDQVKLYSDTKNKSIHVKVILHGAKEITIAPWVSDGADVLPKMEYHLVEGENTFTYPLGDNAILWSEHSPKLYTLHLDGMEYSFGLREFKAAGNYFEINGVRTFLRGKHDGLIFPMTGYAPTDVESWLKVLGTAKDYGINHYRFHTCCPPDAAFTAADILGIYMEPELPFWGTITEQGEENHEEEAQQYLIQEGYRILDDFGNHPSFVMMSMGNELWGSKNRLDEILGGYRQYDNRHLYTQGSNNFQFMPCILENEDFFCGVRFSRDRLFRGSYATCDAPQGHIQTLAPNTNYNYDQMIRPVDLSNDVAASGEITIQYGTGTKTVQMDASEEIIPQMPVVSHEIGQYAMFPDFSEIDKYTGVLKARNLEVFRARLEEKSMMKQADHFFRASGRFAAECYKAELETALRSNQLAGFQILDLQDFTGQGTALIGILNSFMENKGLISELEWREFCWNTVLLAELPKLIYTEGEPVSIGVKLACFGPEPIINPNLKLTIAYDKKTVLYENRILEGTFANGVYQLCEFIINIPEVVSASKLSVSIKMISDITMYDKASKVNNDVENAEITNSYDIWVYPVSKPKVEQGDIVVTNDIEEACINLEQGKKVLLYPDLTDENSIEGTYCTDFWCYPMFRSISESVNKPVPIGTHGLLIDKVHPMFKEFPTESYTTPQWYDFVTNSRAVILDQTVIEPIIWTIDNFERNHRLGNIFEVKVGAGKLMVCTAQIAELKNSLPSQWLKNSILKYMCTEEFNPETELKRDELRRIFI